MNLDNYNLDVDFDQELGLLKATLTVPQIPKAHGTRGYTLPKVKPKTQPKVEPKAKPRVEPKAKPRVEPKVEKAQTKKAKKTTNDVLKEYAKKAKR